MDRHTSTDVTTGTEVKWNKIPKPVKRILGEAGPKMCWGGANCQIQLKGGWIEYECTCHVYGQTHKYTKLSKNGQRWKCKLCKNLAWLIEVRVHLSRLWTDTQVRKAAVVIGSNWTLVGQGTGAPVTSMDRHTSTKATVVKRSKTKPWLSKVRVHLSRLWTDTQVRKTTVAKMSKINLGWTRYECTCHVYGQTHKYEKQQWWKCQKLDLGWSKYKCTCHVYGQTHEYK